MGASARPSRHGYPRRLAVGLPPVSVRLLQTSRLHLPAPLGSPGITRLHRYYGCSDSCAWICVWPTRPGTYPLQADAQVSPLHMLCLPSSPSPTTSPLPSSLWHLLNQRHGLPAHHGSGLRHSIPRIKSVGRLRARQSARPNRVRHPTDCSFASGCCPRRLTANAVTSGFRLVGSPQVDLHLPDKTCSRTHDGRNKSGHDVGRERCRPNCPATSQADPPSVQRTSQVFSMFQYTNVLVFNTPVTFLRQTNGCLN